MFLRFLVRISLNKSQVTRNPLWGLVTRCMPLRYRKPCLKRPPSKRPRIGFKDQLSLNAGQKNCRMLPLEHFAILLTCIKLPFIIKIFVFSIFELQLKIGFTVHAGTKEASSATQTILPLHVTSLYQISCVHCKCT